MGSEDSLIRTALVVIVICVVIAAVMTLETGTTDPGSSQEINGAPVSPGSNGSGETSKIRVLWFNDSTQQYTFEDYDLPGRYNPESFDTDLIPERERTHPLQQAAMVRFLTWDGTVERMTGTKYLIEQDHITTILNRYTLVPSHILTEQTVTQTPLPRMTDTVYPKPEPGMLVPLVGTTCALPDGNQQTWFGYMNRYDHPVTVTIGPENSFYPGDSNRGQPVTFEPGINNDVYSVIYPSNSTNLIWTLMGMQVSAGVVSPLNVSFQVEPAEGYAPLEVLITDRSSGGTQQNPLTTTWSLGDGTQETGTPIRHRYEKPGTYSVTRTIGNLCGSVSAEKKINVYKADYSWKISDDNPRTVLFTDTSGGEPSVWFWDFTNRYTSWEKNPVHTFPGPGHYTVGLTITGQAGSGTVVHDIVITQ